MEDMTDKIAERLNLSPMSPLDISHGENVSSLMKGMAGTAFTGRSLGEAADVLEEMLRDPKCSVIMTLSGAMTMAGLGGLIVESIRRGWIDFLVSTGALVGHGMVENLGMRHYKTNPRISDEEYFEHRLNRVYDTLEPEENLNEMELILRKILNDFADRLQGAPVGSVDILSFFGGCLPGEGILQMAHQHQVPIIIPALTDSELGLDLAVHHYLREQAGTPPIRYDAFIDLERYREFCQSRVAAGQKLAILTIGGGVPRNWAQQVGPYVDIRNTRIGKNDPAIRFDYGIRICPDPVHYGHLSGCTYSEGVSWGKFRSPMDGGRFAEVLIDATVGWPLLARAMIDRGL